MGSDPSERGSDPRDRVGSRGPALLTDDVEDHGYAGVAHVAQGRGCLCQPLLPGPHLLGNIGTEGDVVRYLTGG